MRNYCVFIHYTHHDKRFLEFLINLFVFPQKKGEDSIPRCWHHCKLLQICVGMMLANQYANDQCMLQETRSNVNDARQKCFKLPA